MANRVANSTDVATYATITRNQLVVGDIIIDTATNTASGKNGVFYTNIASTFSTARVGFTVWVNPTLNTLYALRLNNSGTLWSGMSTASNPVTIRPLGGQVKIVSDPSSAARLSVNDLEYVTITGEIDSFPGMKYPWSGFLTNKFGFLIDDSGTWDETSNMVELGTNVGCKGFAIRGLEIIGGFAAVRSMFANSTGLLDYLTLERLYIHDGASEGFYIGMTGGSPRPEFKMLTLRDVIVARRGTELVQLQNLVKSAQKAYVKNFVAYAADCDWKAPFGGGQDNGIQWLVEEGDNILEKFILDGCAFSGVHIHGYTQGSPDSVRSVVRNALVQDTRDLSMYINADASNGCQKEVRDMFFRKFNQTYNEIGTATHNYAFSANNGTDIVLLNRLTWDKGAKTQMFQAISTTYHTPPTLTIDATLADPTYNNHGFPNKNAEQIESWTELIGAGSLSGTANSYKAGDIAQDFVVGNPVVMYLCLSDHTCTPLTKPSIDPVHWTPITWDSDGNPSYSGSYSGTIFSYYPPDDFRLAANSFWNQKGFGLRSNFRNTDHTTFQWYIADDTNATNIHELAGEVERSMTKYAEDKGKYVRCRAYFKIGPIIRQEWVGGWTQLT
jgi:hypothetical protein